MRFFDTARRLADILTPFCTIDPNVRKVREMAERNGARDGNVMHFRFNV